jgi:hypothetical protein
MMNIDCSIFFKVAATKNFLGTFNFKGKHFELNFEFY